MSKRATRITFISVVIILLLILAYFLRDISLGHPNIDTAGKIAFLSDRSSPGHPHVWIMNADGSAAKELTVGSQDDADPAFSPDGTQIAYVSDQDGEPEIYLMDADGANQHAVTIGSDSKSSPRFSPDGRLLCFLTRGSLIALDINSSQTTPLLPLPIAATSSNSSELSKITQLPVTRFAWQPSADPKPQNGAIVAVQDSADQSDMPDFRAVTLLPKGGLSPKILLDAEDVSFAWSPDGATLVVAAMGIKGVPGGKSASGLLLFNSNGQPQALPIPLTPGSEEAPQNPIFSPDGTQIAFEVWQQLDVDRHKVLGVSILPINGGAQPGTLIDGPATDLRWSPDGAHSTYLMPQSPGGQKHDIWAMASDGSSRVNLTHGQGDNTEPTWSPALPKTPGS